MSNIILARLCINPNWIINRIQKHLDPLAVAVNVCQGSNTRADQVALVFARLYKYYTDISAAALLSSPDGSSPVNVILTSLDTRWEKVDHDFFMVAIALNPFVKTSLFAPMVSTVVLVTMIERLYCRVFEVTTVPSTLGFRAVAYLTDNYDAFGYPGGDWNQENLRTRIPVSTPSVTFIGPYTIDYALIQLHFHRILTH